MKLMIASDIHGSAYYCKILIDAFADENADRLLLLGDILYHGPRNDLPRDYSPKQVIQMLNELKNKLLCVRGNCDSEVDQMVLNFPMMADYAVISMGSNVIYAAHGHNYNERNMPPLQYGDILLNGHTHVPKCIDHGDFVYMNPGSVSIPKEESCHSYMTFDDKGFEWKNLETRQIYMNYGNQ